jgi:hypothetical protein
LAGTGRLVVPTRPYVVRAAPGLAPNPGSGLPSTSTGHCDDRAAGLSTRTEHQRLAAHSQSRPRSPGRRGAGCRWACPPSCRRARGRGTSV